MIKNASKIAFPLLLGGAILWWMYRGVDVSALSEALDRQMNWTWMWLSFPFGILAQVFRALRWRQALVPLGERARLHSCVNAVFLSYASSLVVPRVGEVLRCGVLTRTDGVTFSRSLGTVVTERVVDSVAVLFIAVLAFLGQIGTFRTFFEQTGMSLTSCLHRFTPAGYAVTAVCLVVGVLAVALLMRRLSLFARTGGVFRGLVEGLLSLRGVHNLPLFLFYSFGIWAAYFFHLYLTFFCFEATSDLGLSVALAAFVVGCFAVLVPTPNGAGPWHFAVKTVLVMFGVGQLDAALFVLIVHTLQTLLVVVLGLYALVALSFITRRPSSDLPASVSANP